MLERSLAHKDRLDHEPSRHHRSRFALPVSFEPVIVNDIRHRQQVQPNVGMSRASLINYPIMQPLDSIDTGIAPVEGLPEPQ